MKKSYILKFDHVQGDYVIVEEDCMVKNLQQEKRGLFFGKSFFKNFKKPNDSIEKTEEKDKNVGFLSSLDEKMNVDKHEKGELAKGLSDINFNKNKLNIEAEQEEQQSSQTPVTPTPTNNSPSPVQPIPSQPSPSPSNNISVGEGVQLLAGLYNNFRILNMIYQNLRDVNQVSADTFSDFISENIALQGGLLNIYYSVSGQNLPPVLDERVPVLSSRFDEIVEVASAYVKGMRDVNLRLTKIFSVDKFNRQFNLIENALSIQNDYLTGLRIQALYIKN